MMGWRLACLFALTAVFGCESAEPPARPVALGGAGGTEAPGRLNVVLMIADDLGLQLGSYGETRIATPEIDTLAERGMRFTTAHVAQASCSPSRSAIYTGLMPSINGQIGLKNSGFSMEPGLAEDNIHRQLAASGYRTGWLGKLHLSPSEAFQVDGSFRNAEETRDARLLKSRVDEFIGESQQPFFLTIAFADPHMFKDHRGNLAFLNQVQGVPERPIAPSEEMWLSFQGFDEPLQRERVASYLNSVARLDVAVGAVLASLAEHDHVDDTLVIFTSDHGPAFVRAKTTAYDAGLHVPLLISGPGIEGEQVSDELVSLVDLAPTILESAGLKPSALLHGQSLLPVLRRKATLDRPFLYAEMNFHGSDTFVPRRSLLDTRGFHLIHNLVPGRLPRLGIDGDTAFAMVSGTAYDGTSVRAVFDRYASPPEFELYSLSDDPNEFHNLADDPKMQEELELLRRELIQIRTDLGDPLLNEDVVQGYRK